MEHLPLRTVLAAAAGFGRIQVIRHGRAAWSFMVCTALMVAGCMSDQPRNEADQTSVNAVRTMAADLQAAEARGAATARKAIAESDAELNRQLRSIGADEMPFDDQP